MALKIVTIEDEAQHSANNTILLQKTSTVNFPLSQVTKQLISDMKTKLFELRGVGLAAPQVNVNKRIIAIYIPGDAVLLRDNANPYPMHILLNPTYEPVTDHGMTADFEGCYSVKSKAGKVRRYNVIKLTYQDEKGNVHTSIETDFYARVLQHEIDHLNGVLITHRLTPDDIQGTMEEMLALRREALPLEKRALLDELIKKKVKNSDGEEA